MEDNENEKLNLDERRKENIKTETYFKLKKMILNIKMYNSQFKVERVPFYETVF